MLKLTLGTGEVLEIPFDQTSALTVTTVANIDGVQTERAEAHADVVAIELVDDPIVEAPEPVTFTPDEAAAIAYTQPTTPDPATPAAEPVAETAEGISNDSGLTQEAPADPTQDSGFSGTSPGSEAGTEIPSSETSATASPDTASSSEVHESLIDKVEGAFGISHDDAVQAAQSDIAVAQSGEVAGSRNAHVDRAIADVDAALAAYPDSADLADAKAQLESLKSETSGS